MPFTFVHPSVVIPLRRFASKFSMTALIIGSIAPDFEYFLRLRFLSNFSHFIPGIFWFDLPVTIILCFIFHLLIKKSLLNNLPKAIYGRFTNLLEVNWNKYFISHIPIIIYSALIGISIHIAWDALTYKQGYFMISIDFLNNYISITGYKLHFYKIFKYLSDTAGTIYIFYIIFKIPVNKEVIRKNKYIWIYWTGTIIITSTVLLIRFLTGLKWEMENSIIIISISGFMIGITIMGIAYLVWMKE